MTRWLGAALCGLALVVAAAGQQPVQVTLYAESLCPYCKNWILTQAQSLFDEGFSSFIQFRYVAWGNAWQGRVSKWGVCVGGFFGGGGVGGGRERMVW